MPSSWIELTRVTPVAAVSSTSAATSPSVGTAAASSGSLGYLTWATRLRRSVIDCCAFARMMAADSRARSSAPAAGASAAPAAPAPAAPAAKPAAAGVGTKVRDGKFEVTVTGVEDGGTQVGNETFGEKAQGQFWLVPVTVSNIGDKPQMMFDSHQKVRDDQGREFAPNTMAAIHLGDSGQIWMKEINPGNTVQGTLVSDTPAGSGPSSIQLHDSIFSG